MELTDRDLELIKRVLKFAQLQFPIEDAIGNRLYPTQATKLLATDLEERLDQAGVEDAPGLFTPFDPLELKDKIITARYLGNGYEHTLKGKVSDVYENDDETWTLEFGAIKFDYMNREELQTNHYVELEQ